MPTMCVGMLQPFTECSIMVVISFGTLLNQACSYKSSEFGVERFIRVFGSGILFEGARCASAGPRAGRIGRIMCSWDFDT